MVFAAPLFLFLFLPLALAAYFVLPRRCGNTVLLSASVVFYVWGEGAYSWVVFVSIALNFALGRRLQASAGTPHVRTWLALAIGLNLALLAVFKYGNFALANVNAVRELLGAAAIATAAIPLPLGISFFTFHAISYLVDIKRGNATAQRRIDRFALYILLFPQLIAGPIIRYKDIAGQLERRARGLDDFAEGVRRFIIGLAKKVLVANTLGKVADQVFAIAPSELSTPVAWLGVVCYSLQIYFDFSGYSDMAIGLMRMFGFRVLENFNYPYVSQSIREFWRRWHISLSNWFRDYVYIPLGGNRHGSKRAYLNLVIVFLLCGLWHGANWTFIVWGAWHGLFLVLERAGLERRLLRQPRVVRHVYALAVIGAGWVLFRADSLAYAGSVFRALAGFGADAQTKYPLRMLLDNVVLVTLIGAAITSMPLGRFLAQRTAALSSARPYAIPLSMVVEWAGLSSMLVLACAYLAAGTYNPFIYFRF